MTNEEIAERFPAATPRIGLTIASVKLNASMPAVDMMRLSLLESTKLLSGEAVLARHDQWWHGTINVVFREDSTRRKRSLKIRLRRIDDNALRVIQEHVAFDKSTGRELGRRDVYTRMVRMLQR